jgi:hypothetical protein
MTDMALGAAKPETRIGSLLRGTGAAIVSTLRLGGRTWMAAPGIVAIAMLPEFAQHAAEIHLGMFDSRAAFNAAAEDPLRWFFAYPKVAGLLIGILATARFLALGSVREALLIRPGNLLRLLFAMVLTFAAEAPFRWAGEASSSAVLDAVLMAVSAIVQAGLTVYVVGALIGDPENGLRRAFTERWPTSVLLTLLAAIVFVPTQALHMGNHLAAMGQPQPIVWALMIFDTLVVGLMAALLGAALFVAYRAGPTWRGWTERPRRG